MTSTHPIPQASSTDSDQPVLATDVAHDWTDDVPLSTTVLSAVAATADVDPIELPPLNDAIDPDALDSLFAPREDGTRRTPGTVSFEFAGFTVTVAADGTVDVRSL